MAKKKFTELPAATTPLSGTEIIAIVQGGVSKQTTVDDLPAGAGGGTVTSVSIGNLSPLFTASVADPTTTPAISFAAVNQAANLVYAGPANGADAAPTFRALVADDVANSIVIGKILTGYASGAGTVAATDTILQAIQKLNGNQALKPYVTPEEYGAVGDGSTNDQAALASAFSSGFPVFFAKKNYRVNTTVSIPANARAFGTGTVSTTSNIPIFTVAGDDVEIEGLTFLGNSTGAGQLGINVTGFFHTKIDKCSFVNLLHSGVYTVSAVGAREGAVYVTSCFADNCGVGFYCYTQSEYNKIVGCTATNCTGAGVRFKGGNNKLVASTITNCAVGFDLEAGANDGHGVCSGNIINHNTNNVRAIGITNGFLIVGNDFYAGNITVTTSNGIIFQSNQIGGTPYTITQTNNTLTRWDNNTFVTDFTWTTTGTGQTFFNNRFETGTIPTIATNTLTGKLDITGNYIDGFTWTGAATTTANNQQMVNWTGTMTTRATASDKASYFRIAPTTVAGAASQTLYAFEVDASGMGTGNAPTKYAGRFVGGMLIETGSGFVAPFTLNLNATNTSTILNVASNSTAIFSVNNTAGSTVATINALSGIPSNALAFIGTLTAASGSSAIFALNGTTTASANSDLIRGIRLFNTWNINSRTNVTTYGMHYQPQSVSITSGSVTGHYGIVIDGATASINIFSGFMVTAPTAFVDCGAVVAAAASLRIRAGATTTAPTSPNSGDVWHEGTGNRLMFRQGGTSVELIGTSAVNSVSPTSPDRTITVLLNNTTYYIHAKTTND